MKILVYADRKWPNQHSFLEEVLAKRLPAQGIEIEFLAIHSDRKLERSKEVDWHHCPVTVIPNKGLLSNTVRAVSFIRTWLARSPEAYVLVRNESLVLLLLSLLASRSKLLFQLSHFKEETLLLDFRERPALKTGIKALLALGSILVRKFAIKRARLVFPISEAMKDRMVSTRERVTGLFPIPLGADVKSCSNGISREEARLALNLPVEGEMVLYLGTLNRLRGLHLFIDAIEDLEADYPESFLVFVGEGPTQEDKLFLQKYSQAKGQGDRVHFVGAVPRNQTVKYIDAADVGVSYFPENWLFQTNSPTKVMEYLARGLPVAVNEQPEQSRITRSVNGGVVVSDASKFAQGISSVLMVRWDKPAIQQAFAKLRGYDSLVQEVHEMLVRELGCENGRSTS